LCEEAVFFWRVIPVNEAGSALPPYKAWSFTTAPRLFNPPQNLAVTGGIDYAILSWEAPIDNSATDFIGYRVYRSFELGDSFTAISGVNPITALAFTDTNLLTLGVPTIWYLVVAIYTNPDGVSVPSNVTYFQLPCDEDNDLAETISTALFNNFPNPFNPDTTIRFDLASAGNVSIQIFNIRGQRVITLLNEYVSAGHHSITWRGVNEHGTPVGSGIYFFKMETEGYSFVNRMVLLK
jgi:hypothetical protein